MNTILIIFFTVIGSLVYAFMSSVTAPYPFDSKILDLFDKKERERRKKALIKSSVDITLGSVIHFTLLLPMIIVCVILENIYKLIAKILSFKIKSF